MDDMLHFRSGRVKATLNCYSSNDFLTRSLLYSIRLVSAIKTLGAIVRRRGVPCRATGPESRNLHRDMRGGFRVAMSFHIRFHGG